MRKLGVLTGTFLLLHAPAAPAADSETVTVCMPLARAGWEAMKEVYEPVLAGKPKYEAAKKDPSSVLVKLAESMNADKCAQALAMFGPDGMKAIMLNSHREDLAAGKRPRIFD